MDRESGRSSESAYQAVLEAKGMIWLLTRLLIAFVMGAAAAAWVLMLYIPILTTDWGAKAAFYAALTIQTVLALAGGWHALHVARRAIRIHLFPVSPPRVSGGPVLPPAPRDYREATRELVSRICQIYQDRKQFEELAIFLNGRRSIFIPPSIIEKHPDIMRLYSAILRSRFGDLDVSYRMLSSVNEAQEIMSRLVSVRVIAVLPIGVIATRGSVVGSIVPTLREGREHLARLGLLWVGRENRIVREDGEKAPVAEPEGEEVFRLFDPDKVVFLPLVLASQIEYQPISLEEASRISEGRLYAGTSLEGPLFLPPWHFMVIGRTGSGKSTYLRMLIYFARMAGLTPMVYSPKRDDLPVNCEPSDIASLKPEEERNLLVVLDEATEMAKSSSEIRRGIERIIRVGRQNRVFCVLGAQNVRGSILPTELRQHAHLVILPTDAGEVSYIESYFGIPPISSLVSNLRVGTGILMEVGKRSPVIFKFPDVPGDLLSAALQAQDGK